MSGCASLLLKPALPHTSKDPLHARVCTVYTRVESHARIAWTFIQETIFSRSPLSLRSVPRNVTREGLSRYERTAEPRDLCAKRRCALSTRLRYRVSVSRRLIRYRRARQTLRIRCYSVKLKVEIARRPRNDLRSFLTRRDGACKQRLLIRRAPSPINSRKGIDLSGQVYFNLTSGSN